MSMHIRLVLETGEGGATRSEWRARFCLCCSFARHMGAKRAVYECVCCNTDQNVGFGEKSVGMHVP